MTRLQYIALLAGAALALPAAVQAQDATAHDGYIRLGQTWSHLADQGDVFAGGQFAPGADYTTNQTTPITLTAGWFVTDKIAVEGSINQEVETHNYPAGSLAGLPDLGVDAFVTRSLSATWHPMRGQRFSPYFGAGWVWQHTTENTDGFATNFKIADSNGPMLQGGADFALNERFGLFVDLKKAWYHADGSALLGGAPLVADAKIDPVSAQFGVSYRFGPTRTVAPMSIDGDGKWIVRGGAGSLKLEDKLSLKVAGGDFPGATMVADQHWTPVIQIGRKLTDQFAVVATLGLPPEIDASGGGTAAGFGKLAEVMYGPSAFTVQYQPLTTGWFRPYVGAGVTYMIIFKTRDSILTNVEMTDDIAPVIELGADLMVNDRYGFFIEYKRGWLETTTTGNVSMAVPGVGGAPVVGEAQIGPEVYGVGATFRF